MGKPASGQAVAPAAIHRPAARITHRTTSLSLDKPDGQQTETAGGAVSPRGL